MGANQDGEEGGGLWRSRHSDSVYEGTDRGQDEIKGSWIWTEDGVILVASGEDEWRKMLTQARLGMSQR